MCAVDTTLPPITDGLTGVYWASNYHESVSRWLDVSGLGNHASTGGTISKALAAADLNGKDYLSGNTAATVKWPQVSSTQVTGASVLVGFNSLTVGGVLSAPQNLATYYTTMYICRCAALLN